MSLKSDLLQAGKNFLNACSTNASTILTVTAIFGVAATAVISAKCREKAKEKIDEEEKIKGEPLEPMEKIEATWYYYIPPVATGLATMLCIGSAHGIDKKRQLEMVAAYNLLKEGSDKFKKYAIDEIGKNKVKQIEHKIHEDDLKEHPVKEEVLDEICDAATGGVIFKDDMIAGLEFPTTYEKIYQAGERVNRKLRTYGSGGGHNWWSYADFIMDLGYKHVPALENYGWPAEPFTDPIDVNNMCDPHVEEYKGHRCTVVYLNIFPQYKDPYDPTLC